MIACRGQHDKELIDLRVEIQSCNCFKRRVDKMDYGKFIMAKGKNQIINEVVTYIMLHDGILMIYSYICRIIK